MDVFSDTAGEKYLYRYRPDSVYVVDEILNQYIRFSSKESLNDEFEFTIGLDDVFNGLTLKEQNYYLYAFFKANNQLLLDDKLGAGVANKLLSEPDVDHLKGRANIVLDHIKDSLIETVSSLEKLLNDMSVACFCRKPLNSTMMGHYCNNSKGLIISYDRQGLESTFDEDSLFDVRYNESPFKFTADDLLDLISKSYKKNYRDELLGSKHSDWNYEAEVRVVQTNDIEGDESHEISSKHIAGVCFASNATKSFKRVMVNICDQRSIPIFECIKKAGSYDYEAVPIDVNKYFSD
jgi:hypothetical protein